MRLVWLYILAGVMIWPIHWTATTVGDKPIDLMISDLLVLLMPFTYLFTRTTPTKSQMKWVGKPIKSYTITPSLALIFIVYATTLAGIGLGLSGEMIRLYSAFKLAKPIGFVLLGMLIGAWSDPLEFVDIVGRVYGVLVAITMFFTVTGSEFPLGEWGKYIFEMELSGYPNSPMSFYAVLVPLLLASVDSSKWSFAPLIGWGLAFCAGLIILGSMSRSSALALIVGVILYLALTGRVTFLVSSFLVMLVLSVIGFGLFSMLKQTEMVSVLMDRVQTRIDRSTEDEDPSSGRFQIWGTAIELWTERPAFGYMFESFSRYSTVDTPHQQYLEVLHKCGGIGLILYMGLLISCFMATRRLLRMAARRTPAWYQLHGLSGMLFGVMIGNLTQPNLTYSLTGNLVFLLFGCICSSRAVVSASQRNELNLRLPIPGAIPTARAAA